MSFTAEPERGALEESQANARVLRTFFQVLARRNDRRTFDDCYRALSARHLRIALPVDVPQAVWQCDACEVRPGLMGPALSFFYLSRVRRHTARLGWLHLVAEGHVRQRKLLASEDFFPLAHRDVQVMVRGGDGASYSPRETRVLATALALMDQKRAPVPA